jgi:hypothetical protein
MFFYSNFDNLHPCPIFFGEGVCNDEGYICYFFTEVIKFYWLMLLLYSWEPLVCNLQRRARTHAVLVIGLYDLLDNPTTQLIEPPRPLE